MHTTELKNKAIELRKQGFSYSEVLKEIPVAKSTLSEWLRSVNLSKRQHQRLTKKKLAAMKRGAEARHRNRILITQQIKFLAEKEIGDISKRELWLLGIALYWGEGSKEKEKSSQVIFNNSDVKMVKLFLKWLIEICGVQKEDIFLSIGLHESAKDRVPEITKYWEKNTGFTKESFLNIVWKRHKILTKRKNIGNNYYGLLRIVVHRSANFNRKIQGWIDGIYNNCGVV